MAPTNSTPTTKRKPAKFRCLTRKQANILVIESEIAIQETLGQLNEARALAAKAGLSVDCTTLPKSILGSTLNDASSANLADPSSAAIGVVDATIPHTTGGHSNVDHKIVRTGNELVDRITELRRNLWRRHRLMQPEMRQDGRWDKPRLPGERRRRIVRERDLPDAPPEPPMSGFVAFLGQMTVKIRHDRPNAPHDQSKVMQEISKLWRVGLSDDERSYYNQFANEARDEYERLVIEYRATGSYTPNQEFFKLPGANVWVRKPSKRNGLEQEICGYATHSFPKRPPSMDEAYSQREQRSLFKRRLRLKGWYNPDGTLKDGRDFEELFREHQEKMTKKARDEAEQREQRSLFKRRLRRKGWYNPDGTLKDGRDFEELFREHQEKMTKKARDEAEQREQRSLFKRRLRRKGWYNPDGTLKDGRDFDELFREHQEKMTKKASDEADKERSSDDEQDVDDSDMERSSDDEQDVDEEDMERSSDDEKDVDEEDMERSSDDEKDVDDSDMERSSDDEQDVDEADLERSSNDENDVDEADEDRSSDDEKDVDSEKHSISSN